MKWSKCVPVRHYEYVGRLYHRNVPFDQSNGIPLAHCSCKRMLGYVTHRFKVNSHLVTRNFFPGKAFIILKDLQPIRKMRR